MLSQTLDSPDPKTSINSNYLTEWPYWMGENACKNGTVDYRSFPWIYVVFRIEKTNLLCGFYNCKPFQKYFFITEIYDAATNKALIILNDNIH